MEPCDSEICEAHVGTSTPPKDSQNNPIQQDSISLDVKKPPMDSLVNPSSSAANASSGRLVYVRRRVEVDTSKAASTTPPKEPPNLAVVSSSSPEGATSHSLDWEERYHLLQTLLDKLNESDRNDHVQMLWSLSSTELSKHAVELEKRSIQLSLEEASEMQRVTALNVLGRTVKSISNEGE